MVIREKNVNIEIPRSIITISYSTIKQYCENNNKVIIGSGIFGDVYKGLFKNKEIAIKKLNINNNAQEEHKNLEKQFNNEVKILSVCKHYNLVPLIGICIEKPNLCLIYPYLSKGELNVDNNIETGSLEKYFKKVELNYTRRLKIAVGIVDALLFLHTPHESINKPQIIHRDVKPENILLDNDYNARLTDVGISKQLDPSGGNTTMDMLGTPGYIDPDVFDAW